MDEVVEIPLHTWKSDVLLDMLVFSFLGHNHMGSVQVDGYEAKCEYYQEFAYAGMSEYAGLDSAIALVDTSVDCQQYVSWNCMSATINHPSLWGYALTYWMNRDYEEVNGLYICDVVVRLILMIITVQMMDMCSAEI